MFAFVWTCHLFFEKESNLSRGAAGDVSKRHPQRLLVTKPRGPIGVLRVTSVIVITSALQVLVTKPRGPIGVLQMYGSAFL